VLRFCKASYVVIVSILQNVFICSYDLTQAYTTSVPLPLGFPNFSFIVIIAKKIGSL